VEKNQENIVVLNSAFFAEIDKKLKIMEQKREGISAVPNVVSNLTIIVSVCCISFLV